MTTRNLVDKCVFSRSNKCTFWLHRLSKFTSIKMAAKLGSENEILVKEFEVWQAETASECIFLLEVSLLAFCYSIHWRKWHCSDRTWVAWIGLQIVKLSRWFYLARNSILFQPPLKPSFPKSSPKCSPSLSYLFSSDSLRACLGLDLGLDLGCHHGDQSFAYICICLPQSKCFKRGRQKKLNSGPDDLM